MMTDEVKSWLEGLGLSDHLQVFLDNEIDLEAACELNEQDLRELGLAMGPRKKLLRAIAALNDSHAGDKLVAAAEAKQADQPEAIKLGERRQVTVLFADICGYTKLTGELDAETAHAMLTAYFETVDEIIKDFGGSVDKHIGDSVMAVFGAPVSHGNDPERAVRTAAAIHEAMPSVSQEVGLEIHVHIGVASGQVVASGVGSNESYTVTGESVNLASRLTDKAAPNETLVSETVMQAIDSRYNVEDLGHFSLKGITNPVRAFKVLEQTLAESPAISRPFVGRQAELQQLKAVLEATAETRTGHVIYLRGEAGIGKTRITEEVQRMAALQDFDCHRALVLDFGAGKGQDAIRSLTRSLLSVTSSCSEDMLASAVDAALQNDILGKDQAVFLNDLLGLPQPLELRSLYSAMDNARRNQGKCETVAQIVTQLSKKQGLLLVIEDVHWADNLVLEHLASLTEAISDSSVVLVMTSRLEGDQISDSWRAMTGTTPIVTIDLRPLRHADAVALASKFFDATDKFAKACVERADGNPLFLEQLLRGAETATEDAVPGSVQSIVQARMDALDPADKLAIQAAATLGQRFSLEALRHVTDNEEYDCKGLIDRHLIRRDGDAFLFSHALVRDGVYSSLLKSNRCRLHKMAANWYQKRDLVLHAQHLDRAGDATAPKAYLGAARSQSETLHFETAISLSRSGLELAVEKSDLCDLNWVLGDALLSTRATEEAIGAFEAAAEYAPDKQRRTTALSGLAAALRIADRQTPAFEALDEAQKLATQEADESELAYVHYLRGNLYFPLGRIDECMAEHQKSLQLAEKIQSPEAQARALSGLADAHYLRGHMKTACERFKACVELCQQHGFGQLEVANFHMIGWSRIHLMEFREALEIGLASEAMATEVRHNRSIMFSRALAGIMHYHLGDFEAARDALERANVLSRSMGSSNFLAQGLRSLALVCQKLDDFERAHKCAFEALEAIRDVGMTFIGPTVLATCAHVTEDSQQRSALLEEAEAILDSGCVAHNQLWFAEVAIDDALANGEWQSVLRYADRLERFTTSQPLEWSTFMVKRARGLVAASNGERSDPILAELRDLKRQAERSGLATSLPAIEAALEA